MTDKPNATILNVDDDDAARYVTTRLLRAAGYEVIEAANGRDTLELAKRNPDLVVLDVNLPDIDGFEVCRRIKSDPTTSTIPVVHLSATYQDEKSKVTGLESGADGYLTHPVEPKVLVAYVRALLRTREAEANLTAAARQWEATFDAMNDGVCLVDKEQKVLRCNAAMTKLLSKPYSEIIGRYCSEVVHGTKAPVDECPFRHMMENGSREEFVLRKGDRWLQHAVDPLLDEAGRVNGAVQTFSDITELKRAEESLRKAHDELDIRVQERTAELATANLQLGQEIEERKNTVKKLRLEEARLDALLRLGQMSEAPLDEIAGFALDQGIKLTGSSIGFLDFLSKDESAYTIHAFSKNVMEECKVAGYALQGYISEAGIWADAVRQRKTVIVNDYAKPYPTKKGLPEGHLPIQRFMAVPVFERKKIAAVAGVANKASEYDEGDERQLTLLMNGMWGCVLHRQAGNVLRQSEEKYRNLVETSHDIISTVDLEGNFLFTNKAFESLLGYSGKEIEKINGFELVHPEDLASAKLAFARLIEGARLNNLEYRYQTKSGSYIHMQNNASPIFDAQGNVIAAVGFARDITELKQAEAALFKVNRALKVLSDCNEAMIRVHDELELIDEICRIIVEYGGYRLAWVGFAEQDEAKSVRQVGQRGFEDGYLDTINITWADNERGRGPTGTAIRTGRAFIARDIMTDPCFILWRAEAIKRGYASSIALPLIANGRCFGTINIYAVEPNAFGTEEVDLLSNLADNLSYGIMTLRAREELRRLPARLLGVQEDERKRIALELHDSIGQFLAAVKFGLENAINKIPENTAMESVELLQALIPLIQKGSDEVRRIHTDLRPGMLDDLGIIATTSWFCREFERLYSGLRIERQIDIEEREVPEPLKIVIFRVVQEALNNAAKHAEADLVRLSIGKTGSKVELLIEDNGQGFDVEHIRSADKAMGGVGLGSMKERTQLSGGSFSIDSIKGVGTTIRASWQEGVPQ